MDQEPLSPFYHSTKKMTPVAETATEVKAPTQSLDTRTEEEHILDNLRTFVKRYIGQYSRENLRQDRLKIYPNHAHLIEQVVSEKFSGKEQPTPILGEEETQIVQETYITNKQAETKFETAPSEETLDTWVDEVLSEIPEPIDIITVSPKKTDIPHWKSQQLKTAHEQKLTKRQVERRFLKAKMQYYVDSNPTEEFSVKVLCELFPERKADTMTALVKELWKEGLVKGRIEVRTLSRKPKKSTCSYVITSLANPSTNYYTQFPEDNLWFKKKKIGTRHSSSEPDS